MSAAAGIRAGAAYVELATRDNLLTQGLKAAEQKLKNFGSAISGIGAQFAALGGAILTPLLAAAHSFAESGTEMLHLSERTGIGVEALSALAYAAERSGVSTEDLEIGLKKMAKEVQSAADGSATAREALIGLGLSVDQVKGMKPAAMFELIGSRIGAIENETTRSTRAVEMFGRGGTKILPMLLQGAEGMERLRQEAERLGYIKSEASVQAAFQLQLAFTAASKAVKSAWNAVGEAIAPMLTDLFNGVVPFVAQIRAWIKENRALFVTITAVAGAVSVIGTALMGVGMTFKLLAMAVAPFAAIIGMAFGALSLVVGSLASELKLAFTSPFGLLLVALREVTSWLVSAAVVSAGTFKTLGEGFNAVAGVITTAWGGVSDAISAGDWSLAIQIGWEGIKQAFDTGIRYLKVAWNNFAGFFVDIFHEVVNQVASSMASLLSNLANSMGGGGSLALASFGIGGGQSGVQGTLAQMGEEERRERARQRALQNQEIMGQRGGGFVGPQPPNRLDELREEARRKKIESDWLKAEAGGRPNVAQSLDESRAKVDVKGTFSSQAIGGLGAGGSVLDKIADAAAATARNTGELANRPAPGLAG